MIGAPEQAVSADDLHARWREERANRVGLVIAKWGVPLAIVGAAIDVRYSTPIVVYFDLLQTIGCLVSLLMHKAGRRHAWLPLYFSFWLCSFPTLATSGGVYSPF